jgi:hypothetical protein
MFSDSNEIKLPPAFSGPAQLILFTRYGDPREPGWAGKWIHNWRVQQLHPWFPQAEIQIHKHFWPLLQDAFLELEQRGLHNEIRTCHCCHKVAYMHDSPVLSVRSWGAAIDLNANDNPAGTVGAWSEEFVRVMERNGIHFGQNWTGNKDPMHFAMVDGE